MVRRVLRLLTILLLGSLPLGSKPFTTWTITITKSGTGTGVVEDGGLISCGSACSATYADGLSVVLVATPSGSSNFVGWTGDCAGSGSCSLTMDANKSATAQFNLKSPGTKIRGKVTVSGKTVVQ